MTKKRDAEKIADDIMRRLGNDQAEAVHDALGARLHQRRLEQNPAFAKLWEEMIEWMLAGRRRR